MTLTRDYKITVAERARRDPAFAKALREEAAGLLLDGEAEVAALLRSTVQKIPVKSPSCP
ncbi:hypothetical protein BH10PSE16_BH10PSE16_15950 [soil metagenome]